MTKVEQVGKKNELACKGDVNQVSWAQTTQANLAQEHTTCVGGAVMGDIFQKAY